MAGQDKKKSKKAEAREAGPVISMCSFQLTGREFTQAQDH
jgi:hypothetical protein